MDTKFKLLDNLIKFSFPFIALLISYYLFKISNIIKPLSDIKAENIKWAFDLAFNTALITMFYDLMKNKFQPSLSYVIEIKDRKNQSSLILNNEEAENVIPLNCKITLQKKKILPTFPNKIIINYPKWVTLELDDTKDLDENAVRNNKENYSLTIDPNFLFNSNILDVESYELKLKIAPRIVSTKNGSIQAVIITKKIWNKIDVQRTVKDFKIGIL
ncbi:hypothetical protein ACQKDD_11705 [Planococcus kocurii]|uniref:hypothetical protein n=1 Tax=Planococcus kocurii TaxID=1374 RepID=UPI003D020C84